MSDNLKACPFCGGKAKLSSFRDELGYQFSGVRCQKCYCGTQDFKSEKKAIEAWNRRKDNEQ